MSEIVDLKSLMQKRNRLERRIEKTKKELQLINCQISKEYRFIGRVIVFDWLCDLCGFKWKQESRVHRFWPKQGALCPECQKRNTRWSGYEEIYPKEIEA